MFLTFYTKIRAGKAIKSIGKIDDENTISPKINVKNNFLSLKIIRENI